MANDDLYDRNLDPYLGSEDQPGLQEITKTCEVWVTPELKKAATMFGNSWDASYTEELADFDIRFVQLKFRSAHAKQGFLASLKSFSERCKNHFSTDVVFPNDSSGVTATLRIEYFRPNIFEEIVRDLAKTNLRAIPIQSEFGELAKLYVGAYATPIIRVDVCGDEDADPSRIDALENRLTDSQLRLLEFLKLLVASLPSANGHIVVVHDVKRIEVDGESRAITGAAKRALLALALMRNNPTFKAADFVRHYNGEKTPLEPRHDFDNAKKALENILPNMKVETGGGNRTVKNVQFRVAISDVEIQRHLEFLYK